MVPGSLSFVTTVDPLPLPGCSVSALVVTVSFLSLLGECYLGEPFLSYFSAIPIGTSFLFTLLANVFRFLYFLFSVINYFCGI